MAYDITLEGENKMIAERMLRSAAEIFDQCKIDYWLEGGTLLGIRRENRLLPWDNDMDVSMMIDQSSKFTMLYTLLKKKGFRIRTREFQENSDPFKKGSIRMIKLREKKFFGLIKGAVCLDIFIKYPETEMAYWMIADKTKSVPLKFYQSFKSIEFKNHQYKIPELTDEYLTYRYGEWQTPVKEWNTFTDDKALS